MRTLMLEDLNLQRMLVRSLMIMRSRRPVDHSMYFAVVTYRYVIRSRHPKEVFPNK